MKRRLLAPILLLAVMVFATCSKENSDASLASSQSQQAQAAASEDESVADAFVFPGNYTLHWAWPCGLYNTVAIYFNPDGTFIDGFAETGRWTQRSNVIIFNFDGRTDYWAGRGIPRQAKIVGVQADFPLTGCFYLSKEPSVGKPAITKGSTKPSMVK